MEFFGQSPILKSLLGLAVEDIHETDDELVLTFGAGWLLVIYNSFTYLNGADQVRSDLKSLQGAIVLGVYEDAEYARFRMTDGRELRVDLCDSAFRGPEAMQLKGPNGEIVVWS